MMGSCWGRSGEGTEGEETRKRDTVRAFPGMSRCRRFLFSTLLATSLLVGCQSAGNQGPVGAPSVSPSAKVVPTLAPSASASATPANPKSEPSITVVTPEQTRTLTRTELLAHKALETLTMTDEAAYSGQTLTFKALPLSALFEGLHIAPGMTIEFDSLDGFSASLDPKLLLNNDPKGSLAYLAVEEPGHPWPALRKGKSSAGPLYLVWKNPELSHVGQEQWPYQLRSFTIQTPIEVRFPGILPDSKLAKDDPARAGFKLFTKNCFACHMLNGEGNGRLGPDLNEPYSPTEYLHEEYLRKLVRNPQNLRHWKGSRMSAFSTTALPDGDLDKIIAYLKHKAAQRRSGKV